MAALSLIPQKVRETFEIHEWKHACAILATDFPNEWRDILDLLRDFRLCKSWITDPGGNKSKVAKFVDQYLGAKGWVEKQFDTSVQVDQSIMVSPTHDVDCYKNRVALEVE